LFSVTNQRHLNFTDVDPALMVHFVEDGSPANAAGLQLYDHLVAVNGRRVRSLDELAAALKGLPTDQVTTLEILRLVDREDRFLESVLARMVVDEVKPVGYGTSPIR
ncbi:MAG: PDZ domain-containing protein, partial [Gammaproteobacteria bacterium]